MSAGELAFAWRSQRRGARPLAWRDSGTLARELRVLWTALEAPMPGSSRLEPLKPTIIVVPVREEFS